MLRCFTYGFTAPSVASTSGAGANAPLTPAIRRAHGRWGCQSGSKRGGKTVVVRSGLAGAVPVWETLVLLATAPPAADADAEAQTGPPPDTDKDLIDTLWSLQYRTPGTVCASAGRARTVLPPPSSLDAAAVDAAVQAAVFYRFSSQLAAERFIAGPAFASAKAELMRSHSALRLLLWKVFVPNDMEALFKRGPAFDAGLDLVLLLQRAPQAEAEAFRMTVSELQAAALSGGPDGTSAAVQVSAGVDVLSLDERYVLMARFTREDHARRFLASKAVAELMAGRGVGRLLAAHAVQVGDVEQQSNSLL